MGGCRLLTFADRQPDAAVPRSSRGSTALPGSPGPALLVGSFHFRLSHHLPNEHLLCVCVCLLGNAYSVSARVSRVRGSSSPWAWAGQSPPTPWLPSDSSSWGPFRAASSQFQWPWVSHLLGWGAPCLGDPCAPRRPKALLPPARPRLHLWVLPFGRSPFALLPGLGCALGGGPAVNLLTPKPLSWRLVCTSLLLVSLADARRSGLCLVPSSSSLPCVSPSADVGSLAPSLRLWASAATLLLPLQRAHRLRTSLLRVRLRSRWPGFSRLSVGGNKYITACTVWRVTVLKVAPFSCCKTGLRALCARRPSGGGLSSVLIL